MEANRIILDMKYARIIGIIAEQLKIPAEQAMDLFYNSPVFELIDKGVADMHCRSDRYLADEIINDSAVCDTAAP